MPGSDDDYDLVHTFNQAQAGKSKTSRPAVREVGRDGAAVELFIGTELTASDVRDPPSGVHFLFVDEEGDLVRKDSGGTAENVGVRTDTSTLQILRGSEQIAGLGSSDSTTDTGGSITADVTFSTSFSSAPTVLAESRTNTLVRAFAQDVDTDGFTLEQRNYSTSSFSKVTVVWLAVGEG